MHLFFQENILNGGNFITPAMQMISAAPQNIIFKRQISIAVHSDVYVMSTGSFSHRSLDSSRNFPTAKEGADVGCKSQRGDRVRRFSAVQTLWAGEKLS